MTDDTGVSDLHMHTTASDGTCTVEDRIKQAQELGLRSIAITDHDTIADEIDQRVTDHGRLELISGVEVRADVSETKVELLGYYVDPTYPALTNLLEEVRSYRRNRNSRIISRLRDVSSFDRAYEDIRADVDGIVGRPHIAEMLIKDGIVDSIGAAFDEYLAVDGAAFVPMERVSAERVIETIHGAGGVVSLAHPGRIRTDEIAAIIEALVESGVDGIEVPYPYDDAPSAGYADFDSEDAAAVAERFGLLQTGGSDCHGPDSGKYRIGDVRLSQSHLELLREQAATRRPL
jgi:predicted metal-dependent phosphoesterase TrpH